MAVKIVGHDSSLVKKATCRQCSAINEYLPIDVKVLYKGRDYDGSLSQSDGFKCGQCNSDIIIRAT